MKLKLRGCPRADELLAYARQEPVRTGVSRHVARCDTCSLIVENLRRDAKLIEEIRAAAGSALDEATQRDVLAACRAALDRARTK